MEIINAIDYLENRKVFQENEYKWIYPLIKETINGCLITSQLIDEHIDEKVELTLTSIEVAKETIDPVFKIKEISEITNVGLIEIRDEPLALNDSLNIFYGKNGSGKSTIYKSLVNALGNMHVQSQPNIHNDNKGEAVYHYSTCLA